MAVDEENDVIISRISPHDTLRFFWHVDGLVAGSARPGRYGDLRAELGLLKEKGIGLIVNLCEDPLSFPEEFSGCFEELHEPVLDGHPPEPEQLLRIIERVERGAAQGQPCLIHCRGGVGRTATVLIPVMMVLEGLSLDEAVQRLRQAGRYTQTMQQWEFLQEWARQKASRSEGHGDQA